MRFMNCQRIMCICKLGIAVLYNISALKKYIYIFSCIVETVQSKEKGTTKHAKVNEEKVRKRRMLK